VKRTQEDESMRVVVGRWLLAVIVLLAAGVAGAEPTQLFWGDTHLHTSWSPDAYLMRNRSAGPDVAYRYAKGLPVVHPYHKARVQIETPLDFLVVSDHGEYMGVIPMIFKGDPRVAESETAREFLKLAQEGRESEAFQILIGQVNRGEPDPALGSPEINRYVWTEIMDAAERANEPGKFTSFLGWEWSSTPGGANLHRVVFMKEGKETGSGFLPYTSFDSTNPEDLWAWLDETSQKTGASFLAIPHNSNISKGLMFPTQDSEGKPITAEYARTRMRWEPVVEVTQIKGDSETHPQLSPNDEFADYEVYEHVIGVGEAAKGATADAGDYARSALLRGLEIEAKTGANPYRFGMIGSTDSHTSMASAEEDNFHGKMALDSTPETTFEAEIIPGAKGIDMGAAGLAAVWATGNTREALFEAFQRREVYATTGPRLRVRFFGGWDFDAADAGAPDLADRGYAGGVPMGGELTEAPTGKAPVFLIHAAKDPLGANLDRIQIVKGWVGTDGVSQEKVYEVALSDGRAVGADGKAPPVGNTVDLETATWTNAIGDPQLAAAWSDPDFDAGARAFYYARVLQIPTPRHTLYDAIALGVEHPASHPATVQERAYTSPIWYMP
jgi:hypothetical protein